jgi:hypothetical protein
MLKGQPPTFRNGKCSHCGVNERRQGGRYCLECHRSYPAKLSGRRRGSFYLTGVIISTGSVCYRFIAPIERSTEQRFLKVALLKWYPANLTTSFKVGQNPYGIAFDGANMWVTNNGDNTVRKLRANDGATLGTFSVGVQPMGVALDGANIWVANSFDNTATKLRASDRATSEWAGIDVSAKNRGAVGPAFSGSLLCTVDLLAVEALTEPALIDPFQRRVDCTQQRSGCHCRPA